jgi:hypothetical protein
VRTKEQPPDDLKQLHMLIDPQHRPVNFINDSPLLKKKKATELPAIKEINTGTVTQDHSPIGQNRRSKSVIDLSNIKQ